MEIKNGKVEVETRSQTFSPSLMLVQHLHLEPTYSCVLASYLKPANVSVPLEQGTCSSRWTPPRSAGRTPPPPSRAWLGMWWECRWPGTLSGKNGITFSNCESMLTHTYTHTQSKPLSHVLALPHVLQTVPDSTPFLFLLQVWERILLPRSLAQQSHKQVLHRV